MHECSHAQHEPNSPDSYGMTDPQPVEPFLTGAEVDDTDADTPAGRRKRKVRESIMAAAERVFSEDGEQGLSIRRLAGEIDYSPSAIYNYFKSKDDLLEALKEAFFARLLDRLAAVMTSDQPFATKARTGFEVYVRTALERPHHYLAAFSSVQVENQPTQSDAHWEAFLGSYGGKAYLWLRDMVEEGISLSAFRAETNPSLAAKSLWASMHGLAMLMIHLPSFTGRFPIEPEMTPVDFISYHADQAVRGLEVHA